MVGLNEYGFGPQLSMKIFQAYKQNAIEVLENNPYKLIEDVKGIGFQRADELGRKLGLGGNHPERLRAGILFMLDSVCMQQGHVYMEQEVLLGEVTYLLEESEGIRIDQNILVAQVEKLAEEQKIITENTRVYMPSLYYSESGFAYHVKRMLKQTEYQEQFPQSEFLLALGELEERIGVHYGDSQRQALEQALMSPMLVLTGGPGTGKQQSLKG